MCARRYKGIVHLLYPFESGLLCLEGGVLWCCQKVMMIFHLIGKKKKGVCTREVWRD